ncbi:hypothetical protein ERY13_08020 [Paenibacillus mucilaginosus]|uniref:hypothetical protein n=1 Tax=Paenibacillus mucilaginosus TaxID=61624 RepID=UPI0009D93BDD|nr:hypothetical protein [Paenibacillus mucilaginosus]WFA17243.1 hypothetical protein ERY13_08020 [Paenibacillus mucilaginosus]
MINLTEITGIFEKHGIPLSEPKGMHPENVFLRNLNGVAPHTFTINESQLISIYIYSSSQGAVDGAKDFENKTSAAGVVPHSRYLVENILLYYVPDGSQEDERIYLVIEEMRSLQ